MKAAVYARRSTDEHQEESLHVQLEEARRYIRSKGWSLDDAHVYLGDAVSRAEFVK
jgi:DNA invertase Pin-like site-specific DNA recombinase